LHNDSARSLYRQALTAAAIGLAANLALAVAKLAASWAASSMALLSDAVNSLGDCLTSLVVLVALVFAQRPPDEEHPYGHTRAEGIAATNVALLVLVSAAALGWQAVRDFGAAHAAAPPLWTLAVAAVNVVVKEALYRYKLAVGKRTCSAAIMAGAWDHRADALASLAVLIGLTAVRWGDGRLDWADDASALVVVAAIIFSGCKLFRVSAAELMDQQASPEVVDQVRQVAQSIDGVLAVETLLVRKTGIEYLVDIHIEVDAQSTVESAHRVGHAVKDRLVEEFPAVRDVLVHLEPH
jgi:cation diffusion facilitator family transporter